MFINTKKSIILILLAALACLITFNKAQASNKLTITPVGPPIQDANNTYQNITVSFNINANWTMSFIALDSSLKNTNYPDKSINLNKIRIIDKNTDKEYLPEPGKSIIIKTGTHQGRQNENFQIKILNSKNMYPGTYILPIQFNVDSSKKYLTETFIANFNEPISQSVKIIPSSTNHTVEQGMLLSKNNLIKIAQPVKILIQSNSDWKLYMKTTSKHKLIKPNFKILNLSEKVSSNYASSFYEVKEIDMLIAQGTSTVNETTNLLDSVVIDIDFNFLTSESKILPANYYPYYIEYRLMEN